MPNSSNPEQNPNRQAHIPDEWKSLIQDGIYDLNGQRTKEYLESDFGKKELAEEAKFDNDMDIVNRRLAYLERAKEAGEISPEKADKQINRYRDYQERRLNKTIQKIDDQAYRQDFVDSQSVGTPEEQARYQAWLESKDAENMSNIQETGREVIGDRVVLAERGEKTIDATESQTADGENTVAPETSPTGEDAALAAELKKWDEFQAQGVVSAENADGVKREIIKAFVGQMKALADQKAKAAQNAQSAINAQGIADTHDASDTANNVPSVLGAAIVSTDIDSAKAAEIEAAKAAEIEKAKAAELEKDKAAELAGDKAAETTDDAHEDDPTKSRGEKPKEKGGAKRFFTGVAIIAIAAVIGVGLLTGRSNNRDNKTPTETSVDADDASGENNETLGIYDGYGELGMWLSENKAGEFNFANAAEVAPLFNNDECEMVKYTAYNQVESMADYMANLPDSLQPEGFKGLSILETEQKLQSLSDTEFNAIRAQFNQTIDNAFTRRITVNGEQQNAYMRLIDPSLPATHDNMELVECTTNENNLEVTQFYWLDADGNEIGSMTMKLIPVRDANGDIVSFEGCEQIINPLGENPALYGGLETIVETPETPDTPETTPETPPETPETPPETIAPKDEENLERIDENINNDIAEDIGTDEINITPTEEVSAEDITEQPSAADYQGTEPTIIQNEASAPAEQIQEQVSPENNYSQDLGGANANEYAPVQENEAAQAAADAAEIPIEQAPTEGEALENALNDLGIY